MSALDFLGASLAAPSLADVREGRAFIKAGMTGAAVEYVQALSSVVVDGNFGSATEQGVKAFQRAQGLTADGIVGRDTLAAYDRLAGGQYAGVQKVDMAAKADPAEIPKSQARPAVKPAEVAPAATVEATQPSSLKTYAAGALALAALGAVGYAAFGK